MNRRIRVLHLSGAIPREGAGAAALLTHEALLSLGVDSRILFLKDTEHDRKTRWSYHHMSQWHRAVRLSVTLLERLPLVRYRRRADRIFSTGWLGLKLGRMELLRWPDVIHLHWVNHGLVNIADLAEWNKPLVWTMRDMWPFTGGCHHALGCEGFRGGCGKCPLLGSSNKDDLSARGLIRKKRYIPGLKISWVAVSSWLRDEAARSTLLDSEPIRVVPSGVRTDSFRQMESKAARQALGLPAAGKVVLLGANNLREKYKGFAFAIDALRSISEPLTVITFGHAAIEAKECTHRVVNVGYVNGSAKLSELYSAADVFLAPSVGEAFGKTFAEAQTCGLPVVCFANTGPADIVEHLKTGYLATHSEQSDLSAGLAFALGANFDRNYISGRARARFDIANSAKKYLELYDEVAPR